MDEPETDAIKTSGDNPHDYLTANEYHERMNSLQEDGLLELIKEATAESQEQRYTDPVENYMAYTAKPVHVSVLFGAMALLLIVGQLYIPVLNEYLGNPLEFPGWVRLCMLLAGGYCAFIGWPYRKQTNMSDAEQDARSAAKADFQARHSRWRR
jgi:hypothetical protein